MGDEDTSVVVIDVIPQATPAHLLADPTGATAPMGPALRRANSSSPPGSGTTTGCGGGRGGGRLFACFRSQSERYGPGPGVVAVDEPSIRPGHATMLADVDSLAAYPGLQAKLLRSRLLCPGAGGAAAAGPPTALQRISGRLAGFAKSVVGQERPQSDGSPAAAAAPGGTKACDAKLAVPASSSPFAVAAAAGAPVGQSVLPTLESTRADSLLASSCTLMTTMGSCNAGSPRQELPPSPAAADSSASPGATASGPCSGAVAGGFPGCAARAGTAGLGSGDLLGRAATVSCAE